MATRTWTDTFLEELRDEGDAVADAVIAAHVAEVGAEPGHLFRGLLGADAPSSRSSALDAFVAAPVVEPEWYDPALADAGREVFLRRGLHVVSALYGASLPTAYAGWRGVHVLELTGRLESDTRRRLVETARFLVDTMTPRLDDPYAGLDTVRRVRLLHAGVRWLIQHDPRIEHGPPDGSNPAFDPAWGVPVCQADLLNTLLTFTEVVFRAMDRTGVSLEFEERRAYLHAFDRIGWHLGIRADLLPLDLDDIGWLTDAMPRTQFGPSDAGRALTRALLEVCRDAVPWPLDGLPDAMVRQQIGDELGDLLGVPPAGWLRHLLTPTGRITRWIGVRRVHHRLLERLGRSVGRAVLTQSLGVTPDGRPPFALPDHLAGAWKVRTGPH